MVETRRIPNLLVAMENGQSKGNSLLYTIGTSCT